jgi:hypothetical protein
MEGLQERHGALLERVAQLERALEKIAHADLAQAEHLRLIARAALDGRR